MVLDYEPWELKASFIRNMDLAWYPVLPQQMCLTPALEGQCSKGENMRVCLQGLFSPCSLSRDTRQQMQRGFVIWPLTMSSSSIKSNDRSFQSLLTGTGMELVT